MEALTYLDYKTQSIALISENRQGLKKRNVVIRKYMQTMQLSNLTCWEVGNGNNGARVTGGIKDEDPDEVCIKMPMSFPSR